MTGLKPGDNKRHRVGMLPKVSVSKYFATGGEVKPAQGGGCVTHRRVKFTKRGANNSGSINGVRIIQAVLWKKLGEIQIHEICWSRAG